MLTLGILISMSMYAVKLNRYFDIHKDLLLKHKSELLDAINKTMGSDFCSKLIKAKSNLNLVLQKLT